jgi:hypothetical protein
MVNTVVSALETAANQTTVRSRSVLALAREGASIAEEALVDIGPGVGVGEHTFEGGVLPRTYEHDPLRPKTRGKRSVKPPLPGQQDLLCAALYNNFAALLAHRDRLRQQAA